MAKIRSTFVARHERNVALKAFSLYERDHEMINELADFIGCSRSEVVRTAVRALSASLLPR